MYKRKYPTVIIPFSFPHKRRRMNLLRRSADTSYSWESYVSTTSIPFVINNLLKYY